MNHLRKYRTEYTGVALLLPLSFYALVTHTTGVSPRFDNWYNVTFNIAALLIWPIGVVAFIVRWILRRRHRHHVSV